MKPSSFRMRAISAFSLEAGTSTFGWRDWIALRTRVSMSAIGSLVIILLLHFLPASLGHTRNLAIEGELAEAEAANSELAQERAGPSTTPAAVAVAALKFGRFGLAGLFQLYVFRNFCGCGHLLIPSPYAARNGIPICFNSARPSASVRAVVVMEMFIPLVLSTLA